MQQYLAGRVEVDIYPAAAARTAREMLDSKYRSYCELVAEDAGVATLRSFSLGS
jgi:hypothetical protein